jgi:hypothetical protein
MGGGDMHMYGSYHPNTRPEPLEIPMYSRALNRAQKKTEIIGSPDFVVLANILGALLERASPSV